MAWRVLLGIKVRRYSAEFSWKDLVCLEMLSEMGLGGRLWRPVANEPEAAPVREMAKCVAMRNKCALLRVLYDMHRSTGIAGSSVRGGMGMHMAASVPARKNAEYVVTPLFIPSENFPKNSNFGVYLQG